jgi:hypothetical protein
VVTLDLDRYPRFKLRPGKNVVEVQAIDNAGSSYYASYVLLAGAGSNNDPAQLAGATIETVIVSKGADRQPPTSI